MINDELFKILVSEHDPEKETVLAVSSEKDGNTTRFATVAKGSNVEIIVLASVMIREVAKKLEVTPEKALKIISLVDGLLDEK